MKKSYSLVLVLVAAIAAGIAVLASNKHSSAKSSATTTSPQTQTAASSLLPPTDDHSGTASQQAEEASATSTFTPPSKEIATAEFQSLATCAKYRRMNALVQNWKSDQFSWVNYEEARKQFSTDQLQELEKTLAFVEGNAARCGTTSNDAATYIGLYHAALVAAYAGDLQAAQCYVMAPWPVSVGDGPLIPQIRDEYLANVNRMIELGLKAGDWGMVNVVIGTYKSPGSHGIDLRAVALPNDPVKGYGYQRLQHLGAKGDLVKEAGQGLAFFEERISQRDKAEQEKWAAATYAQYFSAHPIAHNRVDCDVL